MSKNKQAKEAIQNFFNVVVKDRKGKYIYDFMIKATSPEEALEKSKEIEESIYEKSSDVGIVNLASDFMDEYDEKTIKVCGEPEKVKPSFKNVDVLIKNTGFKIQGQRLVSIK